MDHPVIPFDLQRMFLGTDPALFYGEILFRTLIIYAYTLTLLRWVGGRTIGQLSTIEFLLVIALGSAVGDSLFYPEVPLFQAMLVITLLVFCDKGLDVLIARVPRVHAAIEEGPTELIRDGIIFHENLERKLLTRSEFFQQLRQHAVKHIGEVRHAYLEYNGTISVFRFDEEEMSGRSEGLVIAPPWEIEPPVTVQAGRVAENSLFLACQRCAYPFTVRSREPVPPCPRCGYETFSTNAPPDGSDDGAPNPTKTRQATPRSARSSKVASG